MTEGKVSRNTSARPATPAASDLESCSSIVDCLSMSLEASPAIISCLDRTLAHTLSL
jgi:hypothetical protein